MSFREFWSNLFRTRTYTGNVIGVVLALTICFVFIATSFVVFNKANKDVLEYLNKLTDIVKDILLLVLGGIIRNATHKQQEE